MAVGFSIRPVYDKKKKVLLRHLMTLVKAEERGLRLKIERNGTMNYNKCLYA